MAALNESGAIIVWVDDRHVPVALTLPLVGHSTQADRIRRQARLKTPCRKRLWQQIVRSKIHGQAHTLEQSTGSSHGMRQLVAQVRSGDSTGREAVAARRYWRRLGGSWFRRDPLGTGLNATLNYGYAVLRAEVARRLCGAGLSPIIGIRHHNKYDPLPLASDLMEPFRPCVDLVAAALTGVGKKAEADAELTAAHKAALLDSLLVQRCEGLGIPLPAAVQRLVASFAAVVCGNADRLAVPQWRAAR
jgi:CRISP-associated protein Cas1